MVLKDVGEIHPDGVGRHRVGEGCTCQTRGMHAQAQTVEGREGGEQTDDDTDGRTELIGSELRARWSEN